MADDYRKLYEEEHQRCNEYIAKVAELEEANEMLKFKLDRIHNNPLWKSTKGLRILMLRTAKFIKRVKGLGGFAGFKAKLAHKLNEKKAAKSYGTASFPDAHERKRQEEERILPFSLSACMVEMGQ